MDLEKIPEAYTLPPLIITCVTLSKLHVTLWVLIFFFYK